MLFPYSPRLHRLHTPHLGGRRVLRRQRQWMQGWREEAVPQFLSSYIIFSRGLWVTMQPQHKICWGPHEFPQSGLSALPETIPWYFSYVDIHTSVYKMSREFAETYPCVWTQTSGFTSIFLCFHNYKCMNPNRKRKQYDKRSFLFKGNSEKLTENKQNKTSFKLFHTIALALVMTSLWQP